MATVHVSTPGGPDDVAACGGVGEIVPWSEATDPQGRHYTCGDCNAALTGGRRRGESP